MSEPEVTTMCDRIGPYFDGELTPAEEARVARHLAGCARCQAELDDLMGLEAAMVGRGGKVEPRPTVRPARRAWILPAAVVAVAAAAAAIVILRPRATPAPAVALAPQRGVEVRFSSPAFDRHRPYAIARSGAAPEPISMQALAALERRGDRAGLVAAHALGGELARAATALPAGADADRAALAVMTGNPEAALAVTPASPVAWWNRALALRDLGLTLSAAAAFDQVAAAHEPGWRDEAIARAAALRAPMAARADGYGELRARTRPPTAADAARFPGLTRVLFLDALRLADGPDAVRALAPIAAALDAAAGEPSATRALDEVLARDPAVRRRFHDRYRALQARTLAPAEVDRLLRELAAAGADARDLHAGALILAGRTASARDELLGLLGPEPSPWYTLMIEREALMARRAAGLSVDAELRAAAARCPAVPWAYRCARLELDLAEVLLAGGHVADAFTHAGRARAHYAAAGIPDQEDAALSYQGEIARSAGRDALALAIFDEVTARAGGSCELERFGRIGAAVIALVRGDLAEVRARLPAAASCGGLPDGQGIIVAVDLARHRAEPGDRARAEAWLTTASAPGTPPPLIALAQVGRGRLLVDDDPDAGRAVLRQALTQLAGDPDRNAVGLRAWATSALVSAGAARADWAAVLDEAAAELGNPLPATCVVVASVDDDRVTVALRDRAGALAGELRRMPVAAQATERLISPGMRGRLAGCAAIAVVARPPLHGRSALLPPELPWFFVGAGAAITAPAAPEQLIVSDPATTSAPRLTPQPVAGARHLTGAAATPANVLAALRTAGHVELHVHGVADLDDAGGSYLVLAPGADGRDRLTARDVRAQRLAGAPVVVLAACRAADVAPHLQARWSLPDAFLDAGARAVIAADADLPDDEAAALFADLRARLAAGVAPAAALAELRGRAPWAHHLMLFQRP